MLNDREKEGIVEILALMGLTDIQKLAKTISRNIVRLTTLEDCINAILDFSPTPESFLLRRAVTREILAEYLQRKGVELGSVFKGAQVGEVVRLWNAHAQQQSHFHTDGRVIRRGRV